ncbi:MAG: YdjY domain-containing protein [Planctomycetota bacterium]|nr:YdjY domain-containing protein [Planctomycetota bacterium]MDA1138042.1 YdjY domain-containing protein [Planctomycetota bacterium]
MLERAIACSRPAGKNEKLPGLIIDIQERCVDIEGVVSLDKGLLELIACTKGSKEHESIITVMARPLHIHTALLVLGARNGNPAMHRQVGEQDKQWIYVPPRGDSVEVYLVFENKEGKSVELPINDFVVRAENGHDGFAAD